MYRRRRQKARYDSNHTFLSVVEFFFDLIEAIFLKRAMKFSLESIWNLIKVFSYLCYKIQTINRIYFEVLTSSSMEIAIENDE